MERVACFVWTPRFIVLVHEEFIYFMLILTSIRWADVLCYPLTIEV